MALREPPEAKWSHVRKNVEDKITLIRKKLKCPLRMPVKRKVFMMIHDRLLMIQAYLPESSAPLSDKDKKLPARISDTLELLHSWFITENEAWDVADSLKALLPELAPAEYIYQALVEEKGRMASDHKSKRLLPMDEHKWSRYFSAKELYTAIEEYDEKPTTFDCRQASARLVTLYKIRNRCGRHNRAREKIRSIYLLGASLLLLPAILLWLFWGRIQDLLPSSQMLSAAVIIISGGTGAVLSRAIRLRELERILELKNVWRTLIFQTILGSTLAVIVFLILRTGAISIGGINPEEARNLAVIGFVSGFSEPFAFGILEKVAALR